MLRRSTLSVLRTIQRSTSKHYGESHHYLEPAEARPDIHCDPDNPKTLTFEKVASAALAIKGGVVRTDCRPSFHLSKKTGMDVFLKMELNQVTGSFKERGGRLALLNLTDEEKKSGVFAASAGNHALALCYHGGQLGVPITVCMPRHAPMMKIDKCISFGAEVIVQGKDISVARTLALELAHERGGSYINGYDHIDILAGTGTIGMEILDQLSDIDAIVVPIGGGGLIAGVATAVKALRPRIEVIGVESVANASFKNAMEHGKPVRTHLEPSLADGLAVPIVGVNSYHNCLGKLDRIISVDESHVAVAVLRLIELEKVVAEGAGAMALAGLISGQLDHLKGKRVVALVTGGNIDSTALNRCIERGMAHDQRLVRFQVVVSDRPGAIAELCEIIAEAGASIKEMILDRPYQRKDIFSVRNNIIAETRGFKSAEGLRMRLLDRYGEHDIRFSHVPYSHNTNNVTVGQSH